MMVGTVDEKKFIIQKGDGEWKWTGYVRLAGKLEKHNFQIEDLVINDGKIIGRGLDFSIRGTLDEETHKVSFL